MKVAIAVLIITNLVSVALVATYRSMEEHVAMMAMDSIARMASCQDQLRKLNKQAQQIHTMPSFAEITEIPTTGF